MDLIQADGRCNHQFDIGWAAGDPDQCRCCIIPFQLCCITAKLRDTRVKYKHDRQKSYPSSDSYLSLGRKTNNFVALLQLTNSFCLLYHDVKLGTTIPFYWLRINPN
jgi:hypothetical protein